MFLMHLDKSNAVEWALPDLCPPPPPILDSETSPHPLPCKRCHPKQQFAARFSAVDLVHVCILQSNDRRTISASSVSRCFPAPVALAPFARGHLRPGAAGASDGLAVSAHHPPAQLALLSPLGDGSARELSPAWPGLQLSLRRFHRPHRLYCAGLSH